MKNINEQQIEKIVNELYEIEMNEGCHLDYIDDYKTEIDFYLSNVTSDTYENYVKEYCSENFDMFVSDELCFEIIDDLINKIKNNK